VLYSLRVFFICCLKYLLKNLTFQKLLLSGEAIELSMLGLLDKA
jgi:hypothetical protein